MGQNLRPGHPRVGIDRRETGGKAIGTGTAVPRVYLRYRRLFLSSKTHTRLVRQGQARERGAVCLFCFQACLDTLYGIPSIGQHSHGIGLPPRAVVVPCYHSRVSRSNIVGIQDTLKSDSTICSCRLLMLLWASQVRASRTMPSNAPGPQHVQIPLC